MIAVVVWDNSVGYSNVWLFFREIGCYTCLLIERRHMNVLQYKESEKLFLDYVYITYCNNRGEAIGQSGEVW